MSDNPVADAVDEFADQLPPGGATRGRRGHETAPALARAAAMVRDRAAGFTYAEIAARHGYANASSARGVVVRAMDERVSESVGMLRAVENDRYEMDQRALRQIIEDPDTDPAVRIRAIDARTRAAARNARMNGLDAPVQVAISAGVAAELDDALREVAEWVSGEVVDVTDADPGDSDGVLKI